MPSNLVDQHHGQALLDSIQNGSYPESEEVISADLPSTAIPHILKLLKQAREDVKVSIRETSRDSAQDIDGWISQAKQLRSDVDHAQDTAQQIVDQSKGWERSRFQAQDAASKVGLLEEEVDFTDTVIAVYERVGRLRSRLDSIQEALQREQLDRAVRELVEAKGDAESIRANPSTRVFAVIRSKLGSLHEDAKARLLDRWRSMIHVGSTPPTISIKHQTQGLSPMDLNSLAEALHRLGLLDDTILDSCKDIERFLLRPLLLSQHNRRAGLLSIQRDSLTLSEAPTPKSIEGLFTDVRHIIEYLSANLPIAIASNVPGLLGPTLISMIISLWLSPAIPTNLNSKEGFQNIIESVLKFADAIESYNWPGKDRLVNWTKETPQLWLNKRQERALDNVRRILASGFGDVETVERVETQIMSEEEDIFGSPGEDDSWNAEWSDEEEANRSGADHPTGINEENAGADVSAWGLGEDANGSTHNATPGKVHIENKDTDAWGWGDEEEGDEATASPNSAQASLRRLKSNGNRNPAQGAGREVTLRETYTITALPREVLDLVTKAISDAETLRKPKYNGLPIASASNGLFALRSLVLTMYRASAPPCYSLNPSGNMFLYNDSLWLAERLKQHIRDHPSSRSKSQADIAALLSFGKRAYGREMESQRTILSDLLDGAQGFSNCTVAPFAQECDLAISSTVGRLREVFGQWQPVLSHSALLQSLGSLLSTVVHKIIVDIEDISDISEPESQRLTAFCNRVASLEDLFLPQRPGEPKETEQASVPLTAVYTPGWLKFQYLVNILESSLVDIKFLWEEGELGLEFEVEELVDLIEALFADSEYRRRAIGDIRRVSGSS